MVEKDNDGRLEADMILGIGQDEGEETEIAEEAIDYEEDDDDESADSEEYAEIAFDEPMYHPLESITQSIKTFTRLRGNPSVFLLLGGEMAPIHVDKLQNVLRGIYFEGIEELDLVLHSGGGDPDVAYRLIELLRHHTRDNNVRINACIPRYAKSAATLLCLGADKIILHEIAELGPLDIQLYEEKGASEGDYTPALNLLNALDQIHMRSLQTLHEVIYSIGNHSRLGYSERAKLAIEFVKGMADPILAQIDPEKLGERTRSLEVCREYGKRLLGKYSPFTPEECQEILQRLIYYYPAHSYVIDFHELRALGFNVELFPSYEQDEAVDKLHYVTSKEVTSEFVKDPDTDEPLYLIWLVWPDGEIVRPGS